jgi:hypothetical protein
MKNNPIAAAILLTTFSALSPTLSHAQTAGTPPAACSAQAISLVGDLSLTVNPESSSASREIFLRNSCDGRVTAPLTVTDFVSETTRSPLRTETAVSQLEDDGTWKRVRIVMVPEKGDRLLKLDVSNLWDSGKSTARLAFGDRELGALSAHNYRLPLPISLTTPTPVTLRRAEIASLILSNGGAHTYPITWTFGMGDERVGGDVVLSPNADAEIRIEPKEPWFEGGLESYFKSAEKTTILTVAMRGAEGETAPALPRKSFSVPVKLETHSARVRAWVSNLTVLLLLTIGAVFSLVVNNWVPNRLRRVALRQKIHVLANRTRAISDRTVSLLRVRLRVQRNQEEERLDAAWTASPHFETVAAEVARSLDDLSARVDLVSRIDELSLRLYAHQDVPVSVVDRWLHDLEPAAEMLAKPDLPTATLDEIRKQIAAIETQVTTFRDPNPAFAEDLFKRWESLKTRLNGNVKNSTLFKPKNAPLKGLMDDVLARTYATADAIDSAIYCRLDRTLARLQALLDAYDIYDAASLEQQKHMTDLNAKNGTGSFIDILENDYVAKDTPDNVRSAKLLVQQMKADVYADDIAGALRTNPAASKPEILWDPPLPKTDEPIRFWLRFPLGTWNGSAAQEKLRCEWDFGDGLSERGWIVTHYFRAGGNHKVTVTIRDFAGKKIDELTGQNAVERTVPIKKRKAGKRLEERTKTEIVYMSMALGAAIAALASGAKQSLAQLDFAMALVAIFLIGYGADSIKNVLTKGRTP